MQSSSASASSHHRVPVERTLVAGVRLDLLQPLVGRQVAADLARQLADGFLLLVVGEVHGRLPLVPVPPATATTAACRGRTWR